MNINSRILVYDIIKLFAIFLVIWGHVLLHLQNYQYEIWDNPLYRWICSFHMPLFMMISGYFSAKLPSSLKEYSKKKFQKLILPALTFGIFFSVSWHFAGGRGYFSTYLYSYWFLKSAFICSILYYLANSFHNKIWGYILTITLSLFFSVYQVNLMYIPYLVGVLVYINRDVIKTKAGMIALVSGLIYIFMYLNWTFEMADYPLTKAYLYLLPKKWDCANLYFTLLGYRVLMGLSGSILVMSGFIAISKHLHSNKVGVLLGKWGSLTLGIYLWQAIIVEHIMMKTINLATMDWYLFNYVVSPVISIVVLGVCIILTGFLKKYKWSAFLCLGIEKKHIKN